VKTTLYVIVIILSLLIPEQGLAKTRSMYGMPRMQHRRQTIKAYRIQPKREWSPCTKHRKRKAKTGYDFPNVADTDCFVLPR
jgi:hypothetical protein